MSLTLINLTIQSFAGKNDQDDFLYHTTCQQLSLDCFLYWWLLFASNKDGNYSKLE